MNESVKTYLNEIRKQSFFGSVDEVGSIKYNISWYRDHAADSYRAFRGVGFLTIFLSVSLPFVLSLWPDTPTECIWYLPWTCFASDKAVATISWAIALAAAANGFFQWGKNWQSRTETYLRLERLFMEWEVAVQKTGISIDEVSRMTMKLVLDAREAIKTETGAFFEDIQFPEISSDKMPDSSAKSNKKQDK